MDAGEAVRLRRLAGRQHSASLVLMLGVMLFVLGASFAEHRFVPPPVDSCETSLDPNVAPWWELTVLPRVGESLARRIVAYREQESAAHTGGSLRKVFRTAADLDRVRGIGPKTVAKVQPYLRFEGK